MKIGIRQLPSKLLFLVAIAGLLITCKRKTSLIPQMSSSDFNEYWFDGKAEISSYVLSQSRYGSVHDGKVVLVYVTEDFSKANQVKIEEPQIHKDDVIPVMKLNTMKEFITGLYKYSLMTSVFTPIDRQEYHQSLKVTSSIQDWCGQSFMQTNWKSNRYEIQQMSYFEAEGDAQMTLTKAMLEDELWTIIRVAPHTLPTGEIKIIASSSYLQLNHKENKVYEAVATLVPTCEYYTYTVTYPELDRTVEIEFNAEVPYQIVSWAELNGTNDVTSARLLKTIKSDYWNRHGPIDEILRKDLELGQ